MSHFAVYSCNVSNLEYVKRGLEEMGLGYKEKQTIRDWAKQQRQVALAVVKDGKVLPIGWQIHHDKDGNTSLDLVAEWFQVPLRQKEFTNQISQLHAKYQVMDVCEDNRWSIDDVVVNDAGEIEILASSFA